jgi:hypothetical protein
MITGASVPTIRIGTVAIDEALAFAASTAVNAARNVGILDTFAMVPNG